MADTPWFNIKPFCNGPKSGARYIAALEDIADAGKVFLEVEGALCRCTDMGECLRCERRRYLYDTLDALNRHSLPEDGNDKRD